MRVGSGNFWQWLRRAGNLGTAGDATDVASARTALGLGTLATKNTIDSSALIDAGVVAYADIQNVTAARLLGNPTGSAAAPSEISLGSGLSFSGTSLFGKVLQVQRASLATLFTSATTMPSDNTIPQITEGGEFLTTVFTPLSASSTLYILVNVQVGASATTNATIALFVDATANALAAAGSRLDASWQASVAFLHAVASGSTSARTYRLRGGLDTGTININGSGGTQVYGGVASTSITVVEIL